VDARAERTSRAQNEEPELRLGPRWSRARTGRGGAGARHREVDLEVGPAVSGPVCARPSRCPSVLSCRQRSPLSKQRRPEKASSGGFLRNRLQLPSRDSTHNIHPSSTVKRWFRSPPMKRSQAEASTRRRRDGSARTRPPRCRGFFQTGPHPQGESDATHTPQASPSGSMITSALTVSTCAAR
jgi:hypothetical protein